MKGCLTLSLSVSIMKFVIVITSGPYGDPRLKLALDIAKSVISGGYDLSVFLYGDGIYNALRCINPATDEYNPLSDFKEISKSAHIYFCESAGMRRGVDKSNTLEIFKSSGLGELSDMISSADRVLSL